MQFERRKLSILVLKGKSSSSVCVSARDAPGPDPVPIAGDRCDSSGSSDPVSTAARRGDGSHCDDGCPPRPDVPLSHHRAALRFRVLDTVQEDDDLSSRSV